MDTCQGQATSAFAREGQLWLGRVEGRSEEVFVCVVGVVVVVVGVMFCM